MLVFTINRIIQSIIVIFLTSIVIFAGIFAIGNPVDLLLDSRATFEEMEQIKVNLGLDKPFWEQYYIFLKSAVKGDFGHSFIYNVPAMELIFQRLPATLELAFISLILSIIIGIPVGVVAGIYSKNIFSKCVMFLSVLGFSLPSFWVGLMLIMVFSINFGWLPSFGRGDTITLFGIEWSIFTLDGLKHIIMPALNLSLFGIAFVIRLSRAGIIEIIHQDYIKFAHAKGLKNSRVMFVYILKNIMIPIVTVLGMEFGLILAFAVVTETVFAWPGIGKLLIDSINLLDRPVVVSYIMMTVFIFLIINLIVDLIYSVLDPRVRIIIND